MKSNFKYLVIWALTIVILVITISGVMGDLYGKKLTYQNIIEYFENVGTDKPAVKEFELSVSNELELVTTDGKKITFVIQDRDLFYEDCYVHVKEYNESAEELGKDKIKYHLE